MQVIEKIHAGYDYSCYAGILKNWRTSGENDTWLVDNKELDKYVYDRLFPMPKFYEKCAIEIENGTEDCYFTVNSFWIKSKATRDVRHLNCFVLDFDYYKDPRYKHLTPYDFFKKHLKKKLPFPPTAVIDSGRGLYVLYSFAYCTYHMTKLYKSITKAFYDRYKNYKLDPKAMNVTQVIRIPGTLNTKSLKEVTVLEFNDTNYTIQDFASLLPYSQDETIAYKDKRASNQEADTLIKKPINYKRRNAHFDCFLSDIKQLILSRNNAGIYKGYREELLYLVRERACWSGLTIDESVKIAKEINEIFRKPLSAQQVEERCKPSAGRKFKTSIDTILCKLEITEEEQSHLKLLRKGWMKKSAYAKRKRRHVLLNLSEAQFHILERRTKVCDYKFNRNLSNKQIADILNVDKSTITRDIKYIIENPSKFQIRLEKYMRELEAARDGVIFAKKTIYRTQKQLLEWLKRGYTALEYLIQELGVAKN